MPHTIGYNPELRIIELTLQGIITPSEGKTVISDMALAAKDNNCTLFLSDYREATIKLSTVEIYELPKLMAEAFSKSGIDVRLLKRALVAAKEKDDYLFYETVVINRGQQAKIFFEMDEAKRWLAQK